MGNKHDTKTIGNKTEAYAIHKIRQTIPKYRDDGWREVITSLLKLAKTTTRRFPCTSIKPAHPVHPTHTEETTTTKGREDPSTHGKENNNKEKHKNPLKQSLTNNMTLNKKPQPKSYLPQEVNKLYCTLVQIVFRPMPKEHSK